MATMPAWLKRTEAVPAAPPQGLWDGEVDEFRLRPLPYEDVFWFAKRVDNSRLVRQADPQARRKCWSAIWVSSMAAAALVILLLPNVLGTAAGYQIHALEQERARLVNERAALEVEEARLLSPQRLEELARMLQFVDPAPGQVTFLNPKTDGSLAALNVSK